MTEGPALVASRRRRALVGASVLGTTVSWNLVNVGAAADVMAAHYQVPVATIGLFTTVLFVAQLLLQIPGGRLADRFGARRVALWCLVAITAANVITALAPSLAAALTLRFVVGFAVGIGFVAGSAYIRLAGGSALAQGIYGGIALGGAGLAIATVPALVGLMAWRAPFVTGAIVAVVGVLPLLRAPAIRQPSMATGSRLQDVLTDRRVLGFGAAQAASFGMAIILGNWVVPLLTRHGNYTEAAAGFIGSLTLLGGIIGRPFGGVLASRRPEWGRDLVMASMLAGGAATALLTLAQPLALAVGASLLIGVAAGIPFGSLFNAVSAIRSDSPAAAIAVMNLPALVALIFGTPLVGLTFGGTSGGRLGFFVAAGLWAATAAALPARELFMAGEGSSAPVRES